MLVLLGSVLLLFIHHGECVRTATANVQLQLTSTSIGTLTFTQNDINSPVRISGTLTSLNTTGTSLGFHVHVTGVSATSPDCVAAGAHFNPYNVSHGPPTADIGHRHVGDLGNITKGATGTASININDNIIQLFNTTSSIIGRTIVIHSTFDDGGSGMGDSNTTGNAGSRVACGLIQWASDTSDGLNITPTISILFSTIFMLFFAIF